MFESAVQPPVVSLFSSTGSKPLALFSRREGSERHSRICFLHDAKSEPRPAPPTVLLAPSASLSDRSESRWNEVSDSQGYTLDQTVLHLQSPDLRKTFIQCPHDVSTHEISSHRAGAPAGSANGSLGIRHPWIHLQVRNLGKEWSFEVGLVDSANRLGIVRLSTFQVRSILKSSPREDRTLVVPLILMPIRL